MSEKQLVWAHLGSVRASNHSPQLPLFPAAEGGEEKPGTDWLLLPASSPRSASEARAKPPLSQRRVPFSARVSESLVFRRRRQLVRLRSLYPLLIQQEHWDIGGNPTELKRDSVKTKAPVRARDHNHFHTLFYLVKVFAVTILITWMGGEGTELVWCILHLRENSSLLQCGSYFLGQSIKLSCLHAKNETIARRRLA